MIITGSSKRQYAKNAAALLGSLLLIVLFLSLPYNRKWMRSRIFPYYSDLVNQARNVDIEHRKELRWRNRYRYPRQIANSFRDRQQMRKAVVLIPPTGYFEERGVPFHVPEPAVFYYFTGVRTTWAHHSLATSANWYVRVVNRQLVLDSVKNHRAFMDTIARFKKYKYVL